MINLYYLFDIGNVPSNTCHNIIIIIFIIFIIFRTALYRRRYKKRFLKKPDVLEDML